MKVLFINPPRISELCGNNPRIIDEERGFNPPLGILYIAAYLEAKSGHEIKVLDCQVEQLDYDALKKRIEVIAPDVIGITAMTMTLLDVLETINTAHKAVPEAKIVLGGPHVHLFPKETIAFDHVDYLVLGEGEKVFARLLDALANGGDLQKIPGLVFKNEDGKIINNGMAEFIEDLDSLPFPARHLTPYKSYSSLLSKGKAVTTMITSRGCPFQCRFCDRPHLGKKFRFRSPDNVVNEIEECVRMGINEFLIYDDTFTVNIDRALAISNEITRRKLDICFDIRARVDTMTPELLRALKKAGCAGIHYGVEAGTNKILKVLNKGINLEQVSTIFAQTKKVGIPVLAYFMIGSPTETREDIFDTFRQQCKLGPDYLHMTILTPFPGTNIYLDGMKQGVIQGDPWLEFALRPTRDFIPPVWNELFSKEELQELLVIGYKRFYGRAGYILKRLFKIRSWEEFKKKAHAGFRVLTMNNH